MDTAPSQPPMQFGAIRLELGFVRHRTGERVVEHKPRLPCEADLIDKLGRHQVIDDRLDTQRGEQV